MENFLAGKNAVVTGASRGIGRAIAEQLARAGASVAICAREDSIQQVAKEIEAESGSKIVALPVDISNSDEVSKFFEFVDDQLGGLDVLVNNAGVGRFEAVADLSIEDWHAVLDTNLSGVFYCCHAALPRLSAAGGGHIINIGSLAAKNAFAGGAAYNASKFGLDGFSQAMMLDHRQDNVRVSSILPGSVDTSFGSSPTGSAWKIAPDDIAQIVIDLLRMPARTLISSVEVRPARPPKK